MSNPDDTRRQMPRRHFLRNFAVTVAGVALAAKTGTPGHLLTMAEDGLQHPGVDKPYISTPTWELVDNGPDALPALSTAAAPSSGMDLLTTSPLRAGGRGKKAFILDNGYDETIRPGDSPRNMIVLANRGDKPYFGNKTIQGEGLAAHTFGSSPQNTLVFSKEIIARYGIVDPTFDGSTLTLNFSTGKADGDTPSITIDSQRSFEDRLLGKNSPFTPTISHIAMIDENNRLTTIDVTGLRTEAQWGAAFKKLNAQALIPTTLDTSMTPDAFKGDIAKTPEQVLAELQAELHAMDSAGQAALAPDKQKRQDFFAQAKTRLQASVDMANARGEQFALFADKALGHEPYVRHY